MSTPLRKDLEKGRLKVAASEESAWRLNSAVQKRLRTLMTAKRRLYDS